MRLIRRKKEKTKSDLQVFSEQFKQKKDDFLRSLDDSRYSLYVIKTETGHLLWESNFCGVWVGTSPDIDEVIQYIKNHYEHLHQKNHKKEYNF